MKMLTKDAIRRAGDYILLNSRVLERRRFDYLFGSGGAGAVVEALVPYRNPDGGFGNALEPDGRGPGSQPVATMAALSFLEEADAIGGELFRGACDYLHAVSAPDGGLPFVHPNIRDYPRAPWWQIPETYAGHLIPTGGIAGRLYGSKVDHPWLGPATEFCWRAIDAMTETEPYEALAAIGFLDHVPDRGRAEAAAERLGRMVRDGGQVALSDSDSGETFAPHDYAATPESLAVRWFSGDELEASLDRLVDLQQGDGSWPVRWPVWTPVTAFEWGGWVTIEAIKILMSHGRVE